MSLTSLTGAALDATGALNKVSAAAAKAAARAAKFNNAALAAVVASGKLSDAQVGLIDQISQVSVGFYDGTTQLVNFFHAADQLKKAYKNADVAAITYWTDQLNEISRVIQTWMGTAGKSFDPNTILSNLMNPHADISQHGGGSGLGGGSGPSVSTGIRFGSLFGAIPGSQLHLGTNTGITDKGSGSTTKGTLP